MLGLWDYSNVAPGEKWGDDDVTYEKGMAFLADCPLVEDWGCGTAYAKRFCQTIYRGVDGSRGPETDVVVDLREYRSQADGILLRHVLEHNHDWQKVLENAIASFRRKLVVVLFTPFQSATRVLRINPDFHGRPGQIPDIGFSKADITEFFTGLTVTEEVLRTKTEYGMEVVFYVSRD
ncbi:MAG: hypothetical protein L0027_05545 [Candidatus Rokubacteria bacterium]|nr:hypothetical protein [Candidatus Rokubacteria bacterium]